TGGSAGPEPAALAGTDPGAGADASAGRPPAGPDGAPSGPGRGGLATGPRWRVAAAGWADDAASIVAWRLRVAASTSSSAPASGSAPAWASAEPVTAPVPS